MMVMWKFTKLGIDKIPKVWYNKNTKEQKGIDSMNYPYPYRVEVFSHEKVVDIQCADWETASTTYQNYMKSLNFFRGHVVDNETGEVLLYFKYQQNSGLNCYISTRVLEIGA